MAARPLETFTRPDRIIIGAASDAAGSTLQELLQRVAPSAPVLRVRPIEAELIKLCSNAMLAVKVSFANELAEICERFGVAWSRVQPGVGLDRRIGPDHLLVSPERGFGGACLPKDLDGLIAASRAAGYEPSLLAEMAEFNVRIRRRGACRGQRRLRGRRPAGSARRGPGMPEQLPNIVLVVFDTARWDRFGCYGYERPTTPFVDGLAEQGLRVETMIANGPWTLPSHGSLFTGLYPSQHGSQWQTGPRLRDSVSITMAEWLRGLGYHTICATNNGLISERTGLSRGFDRYAFRLDLERGRRRLGRRVKKVLAGGDSGGLIINEWVRKELSNAPQPTFLFVNYLECHWSYVPPRRLEKRVGGPRFGLAEGIRYRAGLARNAGPWEAIARADERTLDVYRTMYDGELANADEHLRDLMAILRESGHVDGRPSLVMVTSDHGEHVGEHRLADHHASLDDHLIRVPFVAWGPGVVEPGTQSRPFELVDVFPSLARLLGRELPVPELANRRRALFDPAQRERERLRVRGVAGVVRQGARRGCRNATRPTTSPGSAATSCAFATSGSSSSARPTGRRSCST